jgi:hypothetical protein
MQRLRRMERQENRVLAQQVRGPGSHSVEQGFDSIRGGNLDVGMRVPAVGRSDLVRDCPAALRYASIVACRNTSQAFGLS